ncbi:MAG: hypothetical protein N2489_04890 [Clostridia bacterium]|nr:hypothetical protein [Clostridia bacterium]
MDFSVLMKFLANNFIFSSTVIIISFVLGWLLYDKVVTRGICLRHSLFEKDNLAAWVEFIGAFIFPTLFLAAKSIEGSVGETLFMDLLICITYVLAYTSAFTILRMISGSVVKLIDSGDHEGKITLNNEVYSQGNTAAALYSVALSTIFVSMIKFLDVLPGFFLVSVYKMLVILVFSLVAYVAYSLVMRRKSTLFKEIFIDNNVAAGICFAGFMFAVETMLSGAAVLQAEFDLFELAAVCLVSLILFGVLAAVFKWIFSALIKADMWKEVYEQNNIGAAIGQVALYIGIANVIIHFMK